MPDLEGERDEILASLSDDEIVRVVKLLFNDEAAEVESWRVAIPGRGAGLGDPFAGTRAHVVYRSGFLDGVDCGLRCLTATASRIWKMVVI